MLNQANAENPEGQTKITLKPKKALEYQSIDYASLRNLTNSNPEHYLLPGLGKKGRKFSAKKESKVPCMIEEPRLLITAKQFMKQLHEQSAQSQIELQNNLGLSSFLNSREVTPNNPLASQNRRKTLQSQKNKVNSLVTELFDIQSDPEVEEDRGYKIKKPQFRLYDCILGQTETVYKYIFGKARHINPNLITMWKDCLSHEDKSEIYLPVGDQKVQIPFSNARVYPLNVIEKEFKEIFGTGKNRALTAGEEAVVIESIKRYLSICSKEPLKIGRKDYDIVEDILRDCKHSQLQNFPFCMKQVEMHFKLMATKWKYSGQFKAHDRLVEAALVMGKNNFLDLLKSNILTEFLLKHSNIQEI